MWGSDPMLSFHLDLLGVAVPGPFFPYFPQHFPFTTCDLLLIQNWSVWLSVSRLVPIWSLNSWAGVLGVLICCVWICRCCLIFSIFYGMFFYVHYQWVLSYDVFATHPALCHRLGYCSVGWFPEICGHGMCLTCCCFFWSATVFELHLTFIHRELRYLVHYLCWCFLCSFGVLGNGSIIPRHKCAFLLLS